MKKTAVSLLAIAFSASIFAQSVPSTSTPIQNLKGFELFGTASFGMFGLNYLPANGSHIDGPGIRVGVGGGFFINPCWGITTGFNMATYSTFSTIASGTSYSYTAYDSDGYPYSQQIKVNTKISESDFAYQCEIPLMLNYRHYLPSGNAYYIAGGAKMSFPIGGYFHVFRGVVTSSCNYNLPYNNLGATLSNLPWLGFNTTELSGTNGKISLNESYVASLEVGYLYKLKKTTFVTLSVFGDYGLNSARDQISQQNLVLPTNQYTGIPCSTAVNFVRLMSFGVKASWHINISGEPTHGKKKTYEQPQKSNDNTPINNTHSHMGGHQRMGGMGGMNN